MSGEDTQPGTVFRSESHHGSANGMSNSGFDDSDRSVNHGLRHGGNKHETDLTKDADGAYGGNGLPSGQQNVCYSPPKIHQ